MSREVPDGTARSLQNGSGCGSSSLRIRTRLLVRHTYDRSKVTDEKPLDEVTFPLVTTDQLDDTLCRLAAETSS